MSEKTMDEMWRIAGEKYSRQQQSIDTAQGEGLDRIVESLGYRREPETDSELRTRVLLAVGIGPPCCTLAYVAEYLERQMAHVTGAGADQRLCQRELSLYWLSRQRPSGWFARLRWFWRLVGELRRLCVREIDASREKS